MKSRNKWYSFTTWSFMYVCMYVCMYACAHIATITYCEKPHQMVHVRNTVVHHVFLYVCMYTCTCTCMYAYTRITTTHYHEMPGNSDICASLAGLDFEKYCNDSREYFGGSCSRGERYLKYGQHDQGYGELCDCV